MRNLILSLQSATVGNRTIDRKIAELQGWTQHLYPVADTETGTLNTVERWAMPNSNEIARVPNYSTNIEHAYLLMREVDPGGFGGFGWENGMASAKIGGLANAVQASTPALAMCLASVQLKYARASGRLTQPLSSRSID